MLMEAADKAYPSDYPALFHIQTVLPHLRSLFDFGGNVGNLFYCYSKYLELPPELIWTVYDLPKNNEIGEQLARNHGETRLRFTDQFSHADGTDLFIACGSLHYFEQPLALMIAGFLTKPRYVLINRTPLIDGPALATVQDGGTHRAACILYNRTHLIREFEAIGYELVDTWWATERSLIIPCYPDRSSHAYSGMFFRLRQPSSLAERGRQPEELSTQTPSSLRAASRLARPTVGTRGAED
jgi:putative methyltransferase (TIGR04325 family)